MSLYRVEVQLEPVLVVDLGDMRTALERLVALARHYPDADVLFYRRNGQAWELDKGRCWLRQTKTPQADVA